MEVRNIQLAVQLLCCPNPDEIKQGKFRKCMEDKNINYLWEIRTSAGKVGTQLTLDFGNISQCRFQIRSWM